MRKLDVRRAEQSGSLPRREPVDVGGLVRGSRFKCMGWWRQLIGGSGARAGGGVKQVEAL